MQITGRLVSDATIKTLESGKQLVSFSIADNESYTQKSSGERRQLTTYFNCAYWFNTNVVKILKKGAVVELLGCIGARAYTTNTGDMAASLTFSANHIKVLSYAREHTATTNATVVASSTITEPDEDLPF